MKQKNSSDKKYFLIVCSLILVLAFIAGINAAIVISVKTSLGANVNNTYYAGSPTWTFNLSYINATDINDAVNATVYYNSSTIAWTRIGTLTVCSKAAAGASAYCNGTLTMPLLADGTYLLSAILTNISANSTSHLNTLNKTTIMPDNTAPTGSISCSSPTVAKGGTISCSCSATDSGSGVNNALTNYDVYPSTSLTGDITTVCSFADNVGNTARASFVYTVSSVSVSKYRAPVKPTTTTKTTTTSATTNATTPSSTTPTTPVTTPTTTTPTTVTPTTPTTTAPVKSSTPTPTTTPTTTTSSKSTSPKTTKGHTGKAILDEGMLGVSYLAWIILLIVLIAIAFFFIVRKGKLKLKFFKK